jgi:hypothetical protein
MSIRIEKRLTTIRLRFDFEKYIKLILAALPQNDLIGIKAIRIVERFSNPKMPDDALACYSPGRTPRNGVIELHLPRFVEHRCDEYVFQFHPEIAAYRLSFTLCHEVGHHVHHAWRHGIKKLKEERFANKYAVAGGFAYLRSRSSEVLSSFQWAGRNFLIYGRQSRSGWRADREKMIDWLRKNKEGIKFP